MQHYIRKKLYKQNLIEFKKNCYDLHIYYRRHMRHFVYKDSNIQIDRTE